MKVERCDRKNLKRPQRTRFLKITCQLIPLLIPENSRDTIPLEAKIPVVPVHIYISLLHLFLLIFSKFLADNFPPGPLTLLLRHQEYIKPL